MNDFKFMTKAFSRQHLKETILSTTTTWTSSLFRVEYFLHKKKSTMEYKKEHTKSGKNSKKLKAIQFQNRSKCGKIFQLNFNST